MIKEFNILLEKLPTARPILSFIEIEDEYRSSTPPVEYVTYRDVGDGYHIISIDAQKIVYQVLKEIKERVNKMLNNTVGSGDYDWAIREVIEELEDYEGSV